MAKPSNFQPVVLKNGEPRADYIRRRLREGADSVAVFNEINGPELYTGPAGKRWQRVIVETIAEKLRDERRAARADERPTASAEAPKNYAAEVDRIELTAEEKAALDLEAFEEVAEDRKEALRRQYLNQAKDRLRAQDGLRTGIPRLDELVFHTVNLPGGPQACHLINRSVFINGQTVHLPRHVVDGMREVEFRGWQQEARRDGKPVDFYTKSHSDRATGKATFAERGEGVTGADVGRNFVPGVPV
jgi:hypothetical protein